MSLADLEQLLLGDPGIMGALLTVRDYGPPQAVVAAGAIRNRVWDALHARHPATPLNDVDVVYFDSDATAPVRDLGFQAELETAAPAYRWSVKNQARMHTRHGDRPYRSLEDALAHWSETATAVAVRYTGDDRFEFVAPYGFDDLFALILRPTPPVLAARPQDFEDRVRDKNWLETWPRLDIRFHNSP